MTVNNRDFIAAHRARQTNLTMKRSTRIKPQPLQDRAAFLAEVAALLALEATKRKINAERDAALLKVNAEFDGRLAPIEADIKGRMALASDYADGHAAELLPDKASRSFTTETARIGWRTGNRTVAQKSGVTVEHVVNSLQALGLESYVKIERSINRAAILADCTDDKTLNRVVRDPAGAVVLDENQQPMTEPVLIGDVGLKITQGESFYIEPKSASAETLKPVEAAA